MSRQETNQLLSQKNIFRIAELHRNELRPSVRSYADNLYSQIKQDFDARNINSFDEIEKQARSGQITIQELSKIQSLMERLKTVISKGEIPDEERENVERELNKNLEPIIKGWTEYRHSQEYKDSFSKKQEEAIWEEEFSFLKEKVDSLCVPYDFLITNRRFSQRMLERIFNLIEKDWQHDAGILVSAIINKSLENVSKEEMKKVCQVFNADKFKIEKTGRWDIDYLLIAGLGYELPGGTLILTGMANHIGTRMKGGKIKTDKILYGLGVLMEGGEIEANYVEYDCGKKMKNGKIFAKKAFQAVGKEMTGGEIRGIELGNNVGNGMKGGLIVGEKAQDYLGDFMENGRIEVKTAGKEVGYIMKGGEIYIEESFESVNYESIKKRKGKIYLKGEEVM